MANHQHSGRWAMDGLVYWGLMPQQQPGSYQGGEMMMMKSVFWWRKPEYLEESIRERILHCFLSSSGQKRGDQNSLTWHDTRCTTSSCIGQARTVEWGRSFATLGSHFPEFKTHSFLSLWEDPSWCIYMLIQPNRVFPYVNSTWTILTYRCYIA